MDFAASFIMHFSGVAMDRNSACVSFFRAPVWVSLGVALAALFGPRVPSLHGRETITFDNVPVGNQAITTYLERGWKFAAEETFRTIASPGTDPAMVNNGTPYLATLGHPDTFHFTLSRQDRQPFSLFSFDASELFIDIAAANLAGYDNAVKLDLETRGGPVDFQRFTLDGLGDGPGGIADFQTFTLDARFIGITSVRFQSLNRFNFTDGAYALDNFVVSATVPEPGSYAILATAFFALGTGVALRRRVSSAVTQL